MASTSSEPNLKWFELPHGPFPEEWFDLPPEIDPYWREEGTIFNYPADYGRRNDYFTMKIFANGRFRKVGGYRMYTGGWIKYLDYQRPRSTKLWRTILTLGDMGMTGICYLWYLKPGASMNNGLVLLKDEDDMQDMLVWTKGVREIRIYVTHPSRKFAKNLFLSEIYDEWRCVWPKATVNEISDEEALELGFEAPELYKGIVTLKRSQLPKESEDSQLSVSGRLLLEWLPENGTVDNVDRVVDEVVEEVAVREEEVFERVQEVVEQEREEESSRAVGRVEEVDEREEEVVERDEEMVDREEERVDSSGTFMVEEEEIVQGLVPEEIVQGPVPEEIVQGPEVDAFMEDNNIHFDYEDYDLDTAAFMRTENFDEDYEPVDEAEMEAENFGDDYEHVDEPCYTHEDDVLDDLGPVLDDIDPLPEYSYEHSDQLLEFSGDEDDGEGEVGSSSTKQNRRGGGLQFCKEIHLRNPVLVPNMVFGSSEDFRQLIREYAVKTKKPVKFVKNDKKRVPVKCIQEDCEFFVFCSQIGSSKDLSIKTMIGKHTCGTSMKIPTISVKWLAKKYVNKVRRNPKMSLKTFIGDIFDDLKIEISTSTAYRAIKAAGYLLYGNENQQFAQLWSYAKEMLDTMPGSTVIIKQEEQKFQRIYVCPTPLKMGFLAGCRRFLCLDGCFLKGAFKGQILAAVGLDADNGIYPVAWAIVEVENTDSWTWFVRLLKEDLHMDIESDSWVVMTDQQKGLEIAIRNELPDAEHRLCVKHLHANWSKRFPGVDLKNMMWECARAANEPYFERKMQQLKNVTVEGYEALRLIEPKKWTRWAFRLGTNNSELVNNWAEAFNIFIIRARDQPIITMLNTIQHTIMTRIIEERDKKLKCKGPVGPRIEEVLERREALTEGFIVRASGSPRYEVTSAHHSFVVDIEKLECSCGLWKLGGTPCMHAVSVYKSKNKDPRKYVHKAYQLSTWFSIYNHFLEPLRGPMFWTKSPYPPILPPDIRVLPGRPKRCRTKDAAERREEAEKQAEKQASKKGKQQADTGVFKATRKGGAIHCKICGVVGHNARTCPRKPVDGEAATSGRKRSSTSSSQPATTTSRNKKKKTGQSSSQPADLD